MKEIIVFDVYEKSLLVDDNVNFITYVGTENYCPFLMDYDRPIRGPLVGLKSEEYQIVKWVESTPYGPKEEYISMNPKIMRFFNEESRRRISSEKQASYFKQKTKYLEEKIKLMEIQHEEAMKRSFGGDL